MISQQIERYIVTHPDDVSNSWGTKDYERVVKDLSSGCAKIYGDLAYCERICKALNEQWQTPEREILAKHKPLGYSIYCRNTNHWDISARRPPLPDKWGVTGIVGHVMNDGSERAFRIRGEPGNVLVLDERTDPSRPNPRAHHTFKTLDQAILYISSELMEE